jgi:membrane-bound lytic murein transglycosylase A
LFIRRAAAAVLAAAVVASFAGGEANPLTKQAEPGVKSRIRVPAAKYEPVAFTDLPGWAQDDHLAAFKAFLKSCERVVASARDKPADKVPPPSAALVIACGEGLKSAPQIISKDSARAFFERTFTPNTVINKTRPGVLTGYYEPLLHGSRTKHGAYTTPIYKRPSDLVTVIPETHRGAVKRGTLTHVRKTETGTEPYYTRAQIDQGALKDKGLELLYFKDPIDVFFMQIQGSGRVQLTDGKTIRVQYDGKNGHPYSSIGRYLIEKALLAADKVSMGTLISWLKADTERAKPVLWYNASYVFFRELKSSDDQGAPLGAMNVPLTSGRSLAFDPAYHALGTPVYVSAPSMRHVPNVSGFNRLMVGQDVGSAIKGPERGDIYFGSGDEAGKIAGGTKHPAKFYVLVPNATVAAKAAAQPGKAAAQTAQ